MKTENETNDILLKKVFIIQQIVQKLDKSQRLTFYNRAIEMNQHEVADIIMSLIETLEN
jgi:hypothetical protein